MSLIAEILRIGLQITNAKTWAAKSIYHPKRNAQALAPEKFNKSLTIKSADLNDFHLLQIHPPKPNQQHIFFLHGGAYTLEPLPAHRTILEIFTLEFGFTVHFLFYPLAPEYTFVVTHQTILLAYQKIVEEFPNDKIHLFGDSAGGGLALAFLQTLSKKEHLPMPAKTALISPWVDLSLTNVSITSYEKKDPILSVPALQFAAQQFAGNTHLNNPHLSPIFGAKENLGQLLLLYGTNELFYPDLKQLQNELEAAEGTYPEIYIGPKMLHDWILLPIPEAKITIKKIGHWLLQTD